MNILNRHKKIIKMNKSYRGSLSKNFKAAKQTQIKSLKYAYVGRKKTKITNRKIWIKKINIFLKSKKKENYNKFICKLKKKYINLNRKILSIIITYCNKENIIAKIKN